jgi:hypothetical protein
VQGPPKFVLDVYRQSYTRERRNGWRGFTGEATQAMEMETIMKQHVQTSEATAINSKYPGRLSFTHLPKGGGSLT